MADVIVIGGGLAGLTSSILLAKAGYDVSLLEKGDYPRHRVCGEYVSNEVVPFLKQHDLYPAEIGPSQIHKFQLTSTNGREASLSLDLGAFGISRYAFDHFLMRKAKAVGVDVQVNSRVREIQFDGDCFKVTTDDSGYEAPFVIGAYGKRDNLDQGLNRSFMRKRSPYLGVKYHIKTDFPSDQIALHNFQDGYCGISKVEGDTFNLCYLSHRDNLRNYGRIEDMEKAVLHENPFLRKIFTDSKILFDKPLVISEISFEPKALIENHILMCGDTAGLITPLCGNGMAMAIHGAKILSDVLIENRLENSSAGRKRIEKEYMIKWKSNFSFRLKAGRTIQRLFGSKRMSNVAVNLARSTPGIAHKLVEMTHGKPF